MTDHHCWPGVHVCTLGVCPCGIIIITFQGIINFFPCHKGPFCVVGFISQWFIRYTLNLKDGVLQHMSENIKTKSVQDTSQKSDNV